MEMLLKCVATVHIELRTTGYIVFRGNTNKDAWIAFFINFLIVGLLFY